MLSQQLDFQGRSKVSFYRMFDKNEANMNFKAIMIQAPEAFFKHDTDEKWIVQVGQDMCLHVHQWIEQKWSKKFASFVIPVAIFFLFVFSECYNSLANNVDLLMRSFPKPQCTQTWKVDHVSKGRREWLIKEKISIQEFMTWLISCSWQQIRVAHSPEFIPSGTCNF